MPSGFNLIPDKGREKDLHYIRRQKGNANKIQSWEFMNLLCDHLCSDSKPKSGPGLSLTNEVLPFETALQHLT